MGACWNRWSCDNHNSVILARSGAGKSVHVKLEVLRNLYLNVHVAVVDPEDEYVRLAHRVGGTVVQLGAPGVRLNPLASRPEEHAQVELLRAVAVTAIGGPLTQSTFTFDPLLPAYDMVNLRFGVRHGVWDLAFYVNNLTNERALLSLDRERGFLARVGFLTNQPRTDPATRATAARPTPVPQPRRTQNRDRAVDAPAPVSP